MTEGPILGENKYKTIFFHTTDFLYELSCLIHCKHFVDVVSPIIVIVTSRNIIFFVSMKKNKTLNVSRNISHFWCPNPSQWTIQWNLGHCMEYFWLSFWKVWFCDKMRLLPKKCVKLWFLATILHNLKN